MTTINIEIPGYQSPCIITTEAEKGGTMIYIKIRNHWNPRLLS